MILPTATVKLRAELKPLLSLLSLSFEFSNNLLNQKIRVVIEPHQISIESESSNFVFELEGLILLPGSCRSLRWGSSTELQMTLHANKKDENNESPPMMQHNSSPTDQDFLVSHIESSQSHCRCVGCGVRIFKSQSRFKRVLPLPSENWSDFADIWFCHNHSHAASDAQGDGGVSCSGDGVTSEHVSKLKKFPMLPRADDCLVSSLYMLVDSSHVRAGCVVQTAGRLICKRCNNFIGFLKDDRNGAVEQARLVYKIYHHAVSLKNDELCHSHDDERNSSPSPTVFKFSDKQQHVEDFMSCLLKDQSKLFASFRFILTSSLQAKDQSSISVLLWLLDQELSVFSGQLPFPSQANKTVRKVSQCKYMKLLYKATFTTLGEYNGRFSLKTSNIFEAWRIDNTVHGISLPYPLCKQLIQLLVSSTKTLTKSQRSLNEFHVGFLRVS